MKFITLPTLMERKEIHKIDYESLGLPSPEEEKEQMFIDADYNVKILEKELLNIRGSMDVDTESIMEFVNGATLTINLSKEELKKKLENDSDSQRV
jgi:hypothetical protein